MTLRQAQTFVDRWKPLLGLHSWDIEVVESGKDDLEPNYMAVCKWDRDYRKAIITIKLNPDFVQDVKLRDFDPEQTLLHEMLHCVFPLMSEDPLEIHFLEQGVDWVASLLVSIAPLVMRRKSLNDKLDALVASVDKRAGKK